MRKYGDLIAFFVILLLNGLNAQPVNFLKTFTPTASYSGTNAMLGQGAQGVATLSAGSFILGGSYRRWPINNTNPNFDTLIEDSYLVKNQPNGLTKWFRKYHLSQRGFVVSDVGVKYNNDIIAVGFAGGFSNQFTLGGTILTTDSNGYLKSLRIYPGHKIAKITVLKNKKIALLVSDNSSFLKLVLLDKDYNLLWSKRLFHTDTSSGHYRASEIVEGANNSVLVVGNKYVSTGSNPFALLCDSNGFKINDISIPFSSYNSLLNAANNFDNGFYLVGEGNMSNGINGHVAKIDNQLQLAWYKLYHCNFDHVELIDLSLYSRNNICLLTEPEQLPSYWDRRAGFTFIDSLGSVRKSFVFNSINTDQYPDKIIPLQNGKVLFTMRSHAWNRQLFGVTDTSQTGFCNNDILNWTSSEVSVSPTYNNITMVTQPFSFVTDTAYVYTPKDAEIIYMCSTGPTAPLDTINHPPPVITSLKSSAESENNRIRFEIHPNPASDHLTVTTDLSVTGPIEISVFNSEGKTILNKKLTTSVFPFVVDSRDFPMGMYLLSIKVPDGRFYRGKFIIARE